MFRKTLRCSFCRRRDAEVAKLVAGRDGYICDRCAKEALRIMDNPADGQGGPDVADRRGVLRWLRDAIARSWRGDASRREALSH